MKKKTLTLYIIVTSLTLLLINTIKHNNYTERNRINSRIQTGTNARARVRVTD